MYCFKCGKEIPDESKFCYLCGAEIKIGVEESEIDLNLISKDETKETCVQEEEHKCHSLLKINPNEGEDLEDTSEDDFFENFSKQRKAKKKRTRVILISVISFCILLFSFIVIEMSISANEERERQRVATSPDYLKKYITVENIWKEKSKNGETNTRAYVEIKNESDWELCLQAHLENQNDTNMNTSSDMSDGLSSSIIVLGPKCEGVVCFSDGEKVSAPNFIISWETFAVESAESFEGDLLVDSERYGKGIFVKMKNTGNLPIKSVGGEVVFFDENGDVCDSAVIMYNNTYSEEKFNRLSELGEGEEAVFWVTSSTGFFDYIVIPNGSTASKNVKRISAADISEILISMEKLEKNKATIRMNNNSNIQYKVYGNSYAKDKNGDVVGVKNNEAIALPNGEFEVVFDFDSFNIPISSVYYKLSCEKA